MKKPIHHWQFQVLEGHLDTFGHMNHATYFQIFEQARWDLITSRGFGLEIIQAEKIGPTILEANISYKRELLLRESILIETECTEYKGKIGYLEQKMIKSNNTVAATLKLTVALFDMKSRKIIAPTEKWLHAIGL